MEWITPKTNWVTSDFINVQDYNRLINNIRYLQEQFQLIQYPVQLVNTGEVHHAREDVLFVLNSVEDNVESIALSTFRRPDYAGKIVQLENTPFWDAVDLNRLEGNLVGFYATLQSLRGAQYKVPLYLGAGLLADKVVI